MSALLDPSTVRRLAAEIGLRPTKQRGQNFVIDANTVRRIVSTAGVRPHDHVLEVGPGLGSLTLGLLEAGAEITAIEIDDLLAARLPGTVAERLPEATERLRVITADALYVTNSDICATGEPTALVANLPYNVAVPVLLHLLATLPSLTRGLVMVQLEVAERLVAEPGSKVYGVPSVKLAWYATSRRAGTVSPHVFWPVPNVESGLVAFTTHRQPVADVDRGRVFALIDAAFAQRRKMLRSALGSFAGGCAAAEAALEAANIEPTARGETLTVHDFARLARVLVDADAPGGIAPAEVCR